MKKKLPHQPCEKVSGTINSQLTYRGFMDSLSKHQGQWGFF